jgi:hypothetical protein
MLFGVRKFGIVLGLAGLAALAITGAARADSQGQGGRHGGSTVTLRVCNKTGDIVMVASSYIPIGKSDWLNTGWTRVSGGDCKDIFTTANPIFYARAEVKDNSDQYWGSDIKQCVQYPGPYNFYTTSEDTTCPGDSEPADFSTFHSDGRAVYVWNLNP